MRPTIWGIKKNLCVVFIIIKKQFHFSKMLELIEVYFTSINKKMMFNTNAPRIFCCSHHIMTHHLWLLIVCKYIIQELKHLKKKHNQRKACYSSMCTNIILPAQSSVEIMDRNFWAFCQYYSRLAHIYKSSASADFTHHDWQQEWKVKVNK